MDDRGIHRPAAPRAAQWRRMLSRPGGVVSALGHLWRTRMIGPLLAPWRAGGVAMFHVGRSGSTVLADLLAQHRRVFWDGEIYERMFRDWERDGFTLGDEHIPADPVDYLRRRLKRSGRKWYGFEVKFHHVRYTHYALDAYVQGLLDLGVSHFIVLERRNYLRKLISYYAWLRTGRTHHARGDEAKLTSVRLDVERVPMHLTHKPLLTFMADYRDSFARLRELLADRPMVDLSYEEDLSDDPCVGYRKVCELLELEPQEVAVRLSKTNPFALREMIENYDEVAAALRGTEFEWMLES